MEIKDINNQNSVLAMFRKMTENVGTFEFASLIGAGEQNIVSPSKSIVSVADNSKVKTPDYAEKKALSAEDDNVVSKDDAKPIKERKSKSKDISKGDSASVKSEKNKTSNYDDVAAYSDTTVRPDNTVTSTVSSQTVDADVENTASFVVDENIVVAPLITPEILENIAALGEINYIDGAGQTVITTTGAELVRAVSQGYINNFNPANITDVDGKAVFPQLLNVATTQVKTSKDGIDISMLEAVEPELMPEFSAIINDEVIKPVISVDDTEASISHRNMFQSEIVSTPVTENNTDDITQELMVAMNEEIIVDNKIVDNKKVKLAVKVTNGEEKISYSTRQEIFADNLAVNEAVEQAVNSDIKTDNSPITTATSHSPIPTAVTSNITPQGVAIQVPVENITSVTSGAVVSGVDNISNLTSASLNNGVAAQAKTSAPAAEMKSPVDDVFKGMSREVIEQVKVNITKSAIKGVDKIDISLKPEDLGHIEIKLQLSKDGKLQAHIISSRPETMEILQKDMQSLQKAFADAGFQTDENSLSFSFQDNNQTWQQQREEENGLRHFMGKIFETESGNDNQAQMENIRDGKSALNIRV